MHPKLTWIGELQKTLALAGVGTTAAFLDHVDPLKKLVVLELNEELRKGDYRPIQKLAHGFAKANDCILDRIRREPKKMILEILVKTRLGDVKNLNPLR